MVYWCKILMKTCFGVMQQIQSWSGHESRGTEGTEGGGETFHYG